MEFREYTTTVTNRRAQEHLNLHQIHDPDISDAFDDEKRLRAHADMYGEDSLDPIMRSYLHDLEETSRRWREKDKPKDVYKPKKEKKKTLRSKRKARPIV